MKDNSRAKPDRGNTDEGLRRERANADRALAKRHTAAEEDADRILQHARETADEVLNVAREEADEKLDRTAPAAFSQVAIAGDREREDRAVDEERSTADELLARERAETAQALMRLLPLEREKTDRYLLTERERSDEALSNRDDFLGIVSHDLRDLIGGIAISASVLAAKAPADDGGRYTLSYTDRIHRYSARANKLIGDLLDVAAIEAGKLAVVPVRADAALAIAEVVDTFRDAASTKGISLVASDNDRPLMCDFDHARLLQVFANLVSNAMKFTPEGGCISISGRCAGTDVCFSVADNGAGVPRHLVEAIFERFWRGDGQPSGGIGLGLYICRSIIEAHGGKIRVDSEPGVGSTFHVSLPAPPQRPEA